MVSVLFSVLFRGYYIHFSSDSKHMLKYIAMLHMFYIMYAVCKFITAAFQDLFCDVCIENFFFILSVP